MPRNKDLKRLVRARMKKTGEAYTAARSRVLEKRPSRAAAARRVPAAAPNEYAELAGMSDDRITEKTGFTWAHWVVTLDRHGAAEKPHREIASLLKKTYEVDGWWSQLLTVGYERIKGLRARGQRRDGTYEVNKSRTFNVPVTTLFDAWADAKTRRRWLESDATVRSTRPHKTMRFGWGDGTIVVLGFMPKGAAKSAVAVQHTKITDRETATRLKTYWAERLQALGDLLSGGRTASRR